MYNTIVIGAGITGCSIAALLSEYGRVLLIEQNDYYGGKAGTRSPHDWGWTDREHLGYRVDYGHHVLAANGFLEHVINITGASRYLDLMPMPMSYFYRMGELHQTTFKTRKALKALRYMKLRDKKRLAKLLKYARKTPYQKIIDKYAYTPLGELLDQFKIKNHARELIVHDFAAGYQTTVNEDKNSAADLILCLKIFQQGVKGHGTPMLYPYGGFAQIPEALEKIVVNNNGGSRLRTPVEKIIIKDNKAEAVQINSDLITARNIVYTAPIYQLEKLLDENIIQEHQEFFQKARETKKEATQLTLTLCGATKPLIKEPLDTLAFAPPSELQKLDTYLLISELSETYGVAPQNSTIMSAATLANNETDTEETGVKIRAEIERLFPEFDYARDTDWITCQHFNPVDGVGRTIDWYHEKRLGPKTPIKHLYIAGDSTQQLSPGTDGCASSAVLAAEEILGSRILDVRDVFG